MYFSTLVSKEVLADHLEDPDWVIFDCRFDLFDADKGLQAYTHAHIPGARYANLDLDLSGPITPTSGRHPLPEPDGFIEWLGDNGVGNHSQVVVYDDLDGAMATRLWWMLRHWLGHEQVALLDGGWQSWQETGYPVDSETETATTADFTATPNPDTLVTTGQLTDLLDSGVYKLIDARLPPRFRGEQEPLDPVAGHIPGALNQPYTDNLSQRHLLDPDSLRQGFEQLLADTPADQAIYMCGSGVTACHNLLAMDLAGLTGARLYVGSWSEWITDSSRPVATG